METRNFEIGTAAARPLGAKMNHPPQFPTAVPERDGAQVRGAAPLRVELRVVLRILKGGTGNALHRFAASALLPVGSGTLQFNRRFANMMDARGPACLG
jgi:hypothetical protein